ncbi:hypothetical protein KY084_00200 [Stakelama sp. CBK3Z-3]|uniref:Secreted protein n=2 Tax=Stakelama flava TaxID=2860338 RepID=A0ABS6XGE6_9SPHN|nr:hypothetical protein [Stakelama flava]
MAVALPGHAMAQEKSEPPHTIRSITLYGDEKCPQPKDKDEIVVCSNMGDSPYRIPKQLRGTPPDVPHQSWANRAAMTEEAGRHNIPNSCSAVGTDGQTGCTAQMLSEWRAARKEIEDSENAGR